MKKGAWTLLRAMNAAAEADLLDAEKALGLLDARPAPVLRRRRILRTALLAAVLSALFVGTAYAVWRIELSQKLTPSVVVGEIGAPPTETAEQKYYLAEYGLADSPEARASQEMWDYYWSYTERRGQECLDRGLGYYDWIDEDGDWYAGDPELEALFTIYSASNREMAEKILEIRDRYGLKLHSRETVSPSQEEFYALSGVEPFYFPPSGEETVPCKIIYEDGSFVLEGGLETEEGSSPFVLTRNLPGVLPAGSLLVDYPEEYEQWEAVNRFGNSLSFALRSRYPDPGAFTENAPEMDHLLVFYEQEGVSLTLTVGPTMDCLSRADAEALADCFDFEKACGK